MITEKGYKVVNKEFPSLELLDPYGEIQTGEEFWDLCVKLYRAASYVNPVTISVGNVHPSIKSEYVYECEDD